MDTNQKTRKKAGTVGKKLGAIALTAFVLGGSVQTAFAEGGGGGVPGSGQGTSGAWDLYNMQYDEYEDGSPVQGVMRASTEWYINSYAGPNAGDTSMGVGAKDAIRSACDSALAKAEARGGNQGKSRVVAVMWAGSSSSPWASSSSASSSFYQQRWDEAVVGAGFPGIYVEESKPFIQPLWPEAIAEGGATPSAVCIALNQNEPPVALPAPPVKTVTSGNPTDALLDNEVLASGQFYNAVIEAEMNGYASSATFRDIIHTDKVFIGAADRDAADAVYVLDAAGNRVPVEVSIDRGQAGQVIVNGKITAGPGFYRLVVPQSFLPTGQDYSITDDSEVCYHAASGDTCQTGNSEVVRKVTPAPDKVWVLDENGALTTADPSHTNQQGADEKTFLMGDAVSAVVNGRIPANLAENFSNYQVIDDWTKAAQYVDFTDASKAKVFYETGVGTGIYSDVTSQFDVKVAGTVTTATAKAAFLNQTKGLAGDRKVKLVLSGNFRTDYDTNGETVVLYNAGNEVWNNETIPTNEPPVYTWTPDPSKEVIGSGEESGDNTHSTINGLSVWPGQKLEYSVGVDLRIPGDTARGVKSLAVEDVYDEFFTPDKDSVEFWDSRDARNPKAVPRSAYKLVFDEAAHKFTATFTQAWIDDNVNVDGEWTSQPGWLTMRFTGTVKDNAAPGTTVRNQAFQIINDAKTTTEIPEVEIPIITPDKEDLNTDLIDIDGKTVVKGDHILYRLTLDGGPAANKLAYFVHKLGAVDDYDEEYLDLDVSGVKVMEKTTGKDVTAGFNVQIIDGVVYVFAKQVDSVNTYGETILGDPQPADLKLYDQAPIVPHQTPIIDQALLGQQYWITLDTVVSKEVKDYVIENQARQNIQNTHYQTKIVSNPLTAINPDKDVVIDSGSYDSIDGTEIKLFDLFNYRLNSSEIPANRAYDASQWSVTDTFDRVHDSYTGMWAIYAQTDLYDGDDLVVKKGDLLQDSDSVGKGDAEYFTVAFDEASYTLTAEATQAYFDLVNSRGDLPQAWSLYTKMERIAPGTEIVNTFDELYNGTERKSNVVKTTTPENPAVSLVKYTLSEGVDAGDRDTDEDALQLSDADLADGVRVAIKIRNTGDVPLKNVRVTDATQDGRQGTLTDIECQVPDATAAAAAGDKKAVALTEITYLAIGDEIDCAGTLTGMKNGDIHTDNAVVTGESIYSGKKVTAEDPWNAKAPAANPVEAIVTLAQTGGAGMWAMISTALALVVGGAASVFVSRRRQHQAESVTVGDVRSN